MSCGLCARPRSAELAGRVAEQIQTWDRDHRSMTGPRIETHRADADGRLTGHFVIDERHTRLTVSWPEASN